MTEPTTKERSPSFPFIPLDVALKRLLAFEQTFKRHPAPADKVGLAWGMKEKSSQAYQILAALKSYGLVSYEGSARERKAVLTDEARKYLRAQQEALKEEVVSAAALRPKLFRQFWQIWGAERPPSAVCEDDLVLKHGFTESAAKQFLRVYDETIAFAKITDGDSDIGGNDSYEDDDEPLEAPRMTVAEKLQTLMDSVQGNVASKADLHSQEQTLPRGWEEEALIDDSGEEIRIMYRGGPTIEKYEYIRDYLEFKILRMKRQA